MFCIINTFITLFVAVIFVVFNPGEMLTADYLWKIPLLAFCSVIPAMVLFTKKEPSRREFTVRRILHFLFTAAVVVSMLLIYGWLSFEFLIWFIIFFLIVFFTVTHIGFRGEQKLADKINEKIKNQK
jgi:amino acid transporter